MIHLLDGNVLVALVVEDHLHHDEARTWFAAAGPFATCPITQGTLVRLLMRTGMDGAEARRVLTGLISHPFHELWSDDLSYADVGLDTLIGHRQVTDAYLAALARSRSARLATFDRGVAALHPDVVDLLGSV